MIKSEFSVPDITCDGCANSIKLALAKVSGVGVVEVDVAKKMVNVEHSDEVSWAVIASKMDDIGFPVAEYGVSHWL